MEIKLLSQIGTIRKQYMTAFVPTISYLISVQQFIGEFSATKVEKVWVHFEFRFF